MVQASLDTLASFHRRQLMASWHTPSLLRLILDPLSLPRHHFGGSKSCPAPSARTLVAAHRCRPMCASGRPDTRIRAFFSTERCPSQQRARCPHWDSAARWRAALERSTPVWANSGRPGRPLLRGSCVATYSAMPINLACVWTGVPKYSVTVSPKETPRWRFRVIANGNGTRYVLDGATSQVIYWNWILEAPVLLQRRHKESCPEKALLLFAFGTAIPPEAAQWVDVYTRLCERTKYGDKKKKRKLRLHDRALICTLEVQLALVSMGLTVYTKGKSNRSTFAVLLGTSTGKRACHLCLRRTITGITFVTWRVADIRQLD